MGLDWKYWLGMLIAIIGIVVPLTMSQLKPQGKSIALKLISNTELNVNRNNTIPDISISVGGKVIDSPNMAIFEMLNSGYKPILASDFSKPLKIQLKNGAKIVRVNVVDSSPKDLPVEINKTDNYFIIEPLLLNPSDTIRLTVLTNGQMPSFEPSARIVGINSIDYEVMNNGKISIVHVIKNALLGVLGGVLYFLSGAYLIKRDVIVINRTILVLSMIAFSFLSFGRFRDMIRLLSVDNPYYVYKLILFGMMIVGCFVWAFSLVKKQRKGDRSI